MELALEAGDSADSFSEWMQVGWNCISEEIAFGEIARANARKLRCCFWLLVRAGAA